MEREVHTQKFLLGSILMKYNNGMLPQSFSKLKQCMHRVEQKDMVNSTHKIAAEQHILQYLTKFEDMYVPSRNLRPGAAGGGRSQAHARRRKEVAVVRPMLAGGKMWRGSALYLEVERK